MNKPVGRRILLVSQIVFSAILLGGLIYIADPKTVVATIRQLSPAVVGMCLIVLVVFHLLGSSRLWLLLRGLRVDISFSLSVALTWLGLFASNFLPSTVGGDVVIAAVLHRRRQLLGPVLTGLIVNRLLGISALATLLPLVLVFDDFSSLRRLVWSGIVGLSAILAVALLLAWILCAAANLGSQLGERIATWLKKARLMVALFSRNRGLMVWLWLTSVLMLLVAALAVSILGWSISPQANFGIFLGIVLIYSTVQLIPVAFNGVGLQESAITFCLMEIGWPLHAAATLGLMIRFVGIIISLPGLFVSLRAATIIARGRSN